MLTAIYSPTNLQDIVCSTEVIYISIYCYILSQQFAQTLQHILSKFYNIYP
jgi:hypothetical protein